MKYFIITVDTEGDNLWGWSYGKTITTHNTLYLQRFQDLCDQFSYKPVWLTNWEMACDDKYVNFIKTNIDNCEVGMHLHAWNNPPEFDIGLTEYSGAPYLIEYPVQVMEQKIAMITEKINSSFGVKPVSHRAGRWAVNGQYLKLLYKYGYKVDCSITPGINWRSSRGGTVGSGGADYRDEKNMVSTRNGIVEIPVNTYTNHHMFLDKSNSVKHNIKQALTAIDGRVSYLRPNGRNLKELKWIVDQNYKSEKEDYLMFMIHSSELMPGGSPLFRTKESIDKLYKDIEALYTYMKNRYCGIRLNEYIDQHGL